MKTRKTLVIARMNQGIVRAPEIRYTAAIVENADDLRPRSFKTGGSEDWYHVEKAADTFGNYPWLRTLGQAIAFAELLCMAEIKRCRNVLFIEMDSIDNDSGECHHLLNEREERIPWSTRKKVIPWSALKTTRK